MLFSDIEGSTRLLGQLGVQYGEALSVQRSIIREEVRRWRGREILTEGDSFFVVFGSASDAVNAALAAQLRLNSYPWRDGAALRVRMGLHTGEPTLHEDDYIGMDVHRAARIAAAAHGGQIVMSATTAQFIGDRSPEVHLKDLGWHRLKDIPEPEHIVQLVADGLERDFPPLKSLGTPTNLPRALTPILGRDEELAQIAAQLTSGDVRLVTLTGPGGTGKTRLAIAVADLLGASRADGVYFVALAMATSCRCHVQHHRGEPRHARREPCPGSTLRAHSFTRPVVDLGQPRAAGRGAPRGERAPHGGATPGHIGDLSSTAASDR